MSQGDEQQSIRNDQLDGRDVLDDVKLAAGYLALAAVVDDGGEDEVGQNDECQEKSDGEAQDDGEGDIHLVGGRQPRAVGRVAQPRGEGGVAEAVVERLAEDHEHSKQLARGLADYPQIDIDVDKVVTNILIFSVRNAQQELLNEAQITQFLEKAKEHGVLMGSIGQGKIRAVTHYGLDARDIMAALAGIRRALIDIQIT